MTRPSKKLSEKNLSPYKVISAPSSHAFTLCLPEQFQTVHPIFHISQLELTEPEPFPVRNQPPPPPVEVDGQVEYEVEDILDSKLDRRFHPARALRYLVKWVGYKGMDEETSWIPAQDLTHVRELVHSFHL